MLLLSLKLMHPYNRRGMRLRPRLPLAIVQVKRAVHISGRLLALAGENYATTLGMN